MPDERRADAHVVVVRQLRSSDLGWFAAARANGLAAGRQRAININATLIPTLLTADEVAAGGTDTLAWRASGAMELVIRPLRKNEKNWRFMGPKVDAPDLVSLAEGDFLILDSWRDGDPPTLHIRWDVVMRIAAPDTYAVVEQTVKPHLVANMAQFADASAVASQLCSVLPWLSERSEDTPCEPPLRVPTAAEPFLPTVPTGRNAARNEVTVRPKKIRRSLKARLEQPHILVEMMKHGVALSARAQQDFLERMEVLATQLRTMLLDAGVIRSLNLNQADAWSRVAGRRFSFVDGGVAAIQALGSEPLAIRVGSYSVTPGPGERNEEFRTERILVDELFETISGDGVFDEAFDDTAKLRDAARWCIEVSAVLELLRRPQRPSFVFLHGPLVSEVSPYATDDFPGFTSKAIDTLLCGDPGPCTGEHAKFVAVYLEQLKRVVASGVPTTGVVERASGSRRISQEVLRQLERAELLAASDREGIEKELVLYRVKDPILFECILEEGDYVVPMQVDKNVSVDGHNKIPAAWDREIRSYPKPLISYVKPTADSLPIRVEMINGENAPGGIEGVLDITVHMARLLPRYAFPAGLDIVDKFAKVPAWMSQQISKTLAAQVMRRALESGNPQVISMARRFLSGNSREWLLRPKA